MTLESIPLTEIMQRAYRRHVVIPAFNVPCLPMISTVVRREVEHIIRNYFHVEGSASVLAAS